MKISKQQLRRIIKEEKRRLIYETRDVADQNLKAYQDSVYGGDYVGLDAKIEDAVYSMIDMFVEVNGVSEQEAKQMVVDEIKEILGMPR